VSIALPTASADGDDGGSVALDAAVDPVEDSEVQDSEVEDSVVEESADEPAVEEPYDESAAGFKVRLTNFTGPFDLLLQLIGKHKLDVTEVALHTVTNEFIAYIRAMGDDWDLDEVSEFLVVASTLLDLKAARLLPSAAVEDEEDLALLEARDLLFARLLQYKAFKEAAAHIAGLEHSGARRWPRTVTLEPAYALALPELVLGIGPTRLRDLALKAMAPKILPTVGLAHVHMERVSVREHAAIMRDQLIRRRAGTFRALCADCQSTLEIVARFLALLELYREGLIAFEQVEALGELTVRWTGPDAAIEIEVDEYSGTPPTTESTPADLATSELATADLATAELAAAESSPADLSPADLSPAGLPAAARAEIELAMTELQKDVT
jgi:segregation and condensation protein A